MSVRNRIFLLIAAFAAVRLFTAGSFELALDEGYYWLWSRNLSLSYYDHPPMVAVTIWLTTLWAETELFVRLGSVLGGALSSYLLYRLTVELGGDEEAGFAAALIANLTLIFSVGSLIVSPDTPLIPCYLLALLLFLRASRSETKTYLHWLAAGAAVGLAMLSKYTAVFFFPGALLFLFMLPTRRHWLLKPHPYLAAVAAFIVFSPVIIWNAQQGWASFAFQGKHGLESGSEYGFGSFLSYFGLQVAVYSIGIFFFLLAGVVRFVKNGFATHLSPAAKEGPLFLLSFALPTLVFFTLNSFRATVEGNWPVLGFLPLFVQAGIMVKEWSASPRVRPLWRGSLAVAVLLFVFLHVQLISPVIPHPKRFEISRRVYGWKILAAMIDGERRSFNPSFVLADRFQTATLMAYYTSPHMIPYMVGGDNARRFFYQTPLNERIGENAIYLTETSRDESARLQAVFGGVEKVADIDIIRMGELIRRFSLYRCYNYRGGLEGL